MGLSHRCPLDNCGWDIEPLRQIDTTAHAPNANDYILLYGAVISHLEQTHQPRGVASNG